jgi:hypothetical protein
MTERFMAGDKVIAFYDAVAPLDPVFAKFYREDSAWYPAVVVRQKPDGDYIVRREETRQDRTQRGSHVPATWAVDPEHIRRRPERGPF